MWNCQQCSNWASQKICNSSPPNKTATSSPGEQEDIEKIIKAIIVWPAIIKIDRFLWVVITNWGTRRTAKTEEDPRGVNIVRWYSFIGPDAGKIAELSKRQTMIMFNLCYSV